MTTYAYIRVSTDAQDLDNQRHGVIEYAKRHGWDNLVYFEDKKSGKKDWRERDLGRLMDTTIEGDVLLFAEVSRAARSTKQVLDILEVAVKKKIMVHFVKEGIKTDGSMMSDVIITVFAMIGQVEASFIGIRTKEAIARRKAAGLPVGRRKGSKNHEKKLDKNKDEIKDLLSKGVHKTSIARIIGCDPHTLYSWMEANGLSRYIKSDNAKSPRKKKSTEAVDKIAA